MDAITIDRAAALTPSLLDSLETLVCCESPTEDLAACARMANVAAAVVTQWLGSPARVEEHEGRPVVRWGPAQPRYLLLGHLDTVWPIGTLARIPWAVTGDRITGPGVFDMKAGIVQALAALSLTSARECGLLLTTDEETGSHASRAVIADAITHATAVLVFEPSADGALKTERKGTSWYRVSFEGRAAHAGLDPHRGINATVEAAALILATTEWGDGEQGTTVTPTLLSAGTTANTVPALAQLTLDVRAWSEPEQVRIDEQMRGWSVRHPEALMHIDGGIDRPAMEATSSKALFDAAAQCAVDLGLPALASCSVGGASDGNLTAAAGVPTLDGLGAVGDGAHADHEWASVSALHERAALVAALLNHLDATTNIDEGVPS